MQKKVTTLTLVYNTNNCSKITVGKLYKGTKTLDLNIRTIFAREY